MSADDASLVMPHVVEEITAVTYEVQADAMRSLLAALPSHAHAGGVTQGHLNFGDGFMLVSATDDAHDLAAQAMAAWCPDDDDDDLRQACVAEVRSTLVRLQAQELKRLQEVTLHFKRDTPTLAPRSVTFHDTLT